MPRPLGVVGPDSLPLWDTFEAIYFLVAGLSVGIVLGFLFPSLWRTLRRRFRDTSRFGYDLSNHSVRNPMKSLEARETETEKEPPSLFAIDEMFVRARFYVQEGNHRQAIQKYLEILGDERVSKQGTNRALFELSQTYFLLGIHSRAYDTAIELLHRKPTHEGVLLHIIRILDAERNYERFPEVLSIWKGDPSPQLREEISRALVLHGDKLYKKGTVKEAKDLALRAARWNLSAGRPRILLWLIASSEVWKKCGNNSITMWSSFLADLETRRRISQETAISPLIGADYLGTLLSRLCLSAAFTPETLQNVPSSLPKMGLTDEEQEKYELLLFATFLTSYQELTETLRDKLKEVLISLAPGLKVSIENYYILDPAGRLLLRHGIEAHQCSRCQLILGSHRWECPSCNGFETFIPTINLKRSNIKSNDFANE